MKDLLLFPYNGNTREALGVINAINDNNPEWNVIGFIDDDASRHSETFGGHEVIGDRSLFRELPKAYVLAAHGRPETHWQRLAIIDSLQLENERFASLIHPKAEIGPECRIGKNCLIMSGVTLTAGVSLADHVVILPNTVISHESSIGAGTLIGSNVSISGGVSIEKECYIGSGTKIIQETTIERRSLLGIGSVAIRSIPTNSVAIGNPSRVIRQNKT